MSQIRLYSVADLKENPESVAVHSDFDPAGKDAWLMADIAANGVIIPIVVRPDGVISDGWRRWMCARKQGLAEIPGFQSTDDVFHSAQLGRVLSTYAKCVLYRDKIEALTNAGRNARQENLPKLRGADPDGKRHELEQGWIQLELILGVQRQTLQRGIVLLKEIEALRAKGTIDDENQATKLTNVFRNRGVQPTLRLMDHETDLESEDESDCQSWEADEIPKTIRKNTSKKLVKACKKESATKSKPSADDPPALDHWQADALATLSIIKRTFDTKGISNAKTDAAFSVLRNTINKPQLKVAA